MALLKSACATPSPILVAKNSTAYFDIGSIPEIEQRFSYIAHYLVVCRAVDLVDLVDYNYMVNPYFSSEQLQNIPTVALEIIKNFIGINCESIVFCYDRNGTGDLRFKSETHEFIIY